MDALYKIEDIIVFNPLKDSYKAMLNETNYPYTDRLIDYVEARRDEWLEEAGDIRFYILSEQKIELNHKPKPPKNNTNHAYYTGANRKIKS